MNDRGIRSVHMYVRKSDNKTLYDVPYTLRGEPHRMSELSASGREAAIKSAPTNLPIKGLIIAVYIKVAKKHWHHFLRTTGKYLSHLIGSCAERHGR